MVVYFDGSDYMDKMSYGFIIFENGQHHEFSGVIHRARTKIDSGCHETIAFLKAVEKIIDMGLDPMKFTYYTDDAETGYASTYLYDANYCGSRRKNVFLSKLKRVLRKHGENNQVTFELLINILINCRFCKLKGHNNLVYNERTDYISKCAAKEVEPKDYCSWVKKGFKRYKGNSVYETYVPHFA